MEVKEKGDDPVCLLEDPFDGLPFSLFLPLVFSFPLTFRQMDQSYQGTINTCKKFRINQEEALKNLIEEFALSEDKAKEYMNLYW